MKLNRVLLCLGLAAETLSMWDNPQPLLGPGFSGSGAGLGA